MNTKVDITFYHASWCSHCHHFAPKWNQFEKEINEYSQKRHYNITTHSISDEDIQSRNLNETIDGKEIEGYPTIKISVTHGDQKHEYEYEGKREVRDLFEHIRSKFKKSK